MSFAELGIDAGYLDSFPDSFLDSFREKKRPRQLPRPFLRFANQEARYTPTLIRFPSFWGYLEGCYLISERLDFLDQLSLGLLFVIGLGLGCLVLSNQIECPLFYLWQDRLH